MDLNEPQPTDPHRRPARRGVLASLRASFLTGLVVILPVAVTFWLIWALMGWIDSWMLPLVPERWQPEQSIGINLRGIGVVFFLIFTVLIGWLAKGLIGRSLIRLGESLVNRTPIVRSVYGGVKQIAETVLATNDTRFDRACLIEYPRPGIHALAFVSSPARGEVARAFDRPMLAVFLPTTPNPTSGFLLYLPAEDVRILDMSIEDAAKLVISAGLVYPADSARQKAVQENSAARSTVS